mgnify:CR=1 FL=1
MRPKGASRGRRNPSPSSGGPHLAKKGPGRGFGTRSAATIDDADHQQSNLSNSKTSLRLFSPTDC